MTITPTFWKKTGIQDWFLKKETIVKQGEAVTPDVVYKYLVEKFKDSVAELSFADRVIFYHEYIVCFSPSDYNKFMDNNKGIFALIIKESVKTFYDILLQHSRHGKHVTASANKWVFRFVSHPDYEKGDKSFMGKLLPGSAQQQKDDNLRVTFIPRQTGIAQTFDISDDLLKDFTFYSDGYYELFYNKNLVLDEAPLTGQDACLARLETTIPDKQYVGKKLEYLMKQDEILVSGPHETPDEPGVFHVPSEWVSSPHLSIRFDKDAGKFFLASFGERTLVNENEVKASDRGRPVWTELPLNSRVVLNGIVCINFFKF